MASFIKKTINLLFAEDPIRPLLKVTKKDRPTKKLSERELIEKESQIGRDIFGPAPANVTRREFFNLDQDTWMWHEETKNPDGTKSAHTVRYEIQPQGILKVMSGPKYEYLEGTELSNFVKATQEYYERVSTALYRRNPRTGKPL